MRACGSCFYGKFIYGEEDGVCFVRPPMVFVAPSDAAALMAGTITVNQADMSRLETVQVRPAVSRSDYCGWFSHKKEIPLSPGDGPHSLPPAPPRPLPEDPFFVERPRERS